MEIDKSDAKIHFGIGIAYYDITQYRNPLDFLNAATGFDPSLENNEVMIKLRKEIGNKYTPNPS